MSEDKREQEMEWLGPGDWPRDAREHIAALQAQVAQMRGALEKTRLWMTYKGGLCRACKRPWESHDPECFIGQALSSSPASQKWKAAAKEVNAALDWLAYALGTCQWTGDESHAKAHEQYWKARAALGTLRSEPVADRT